MTAMASPVSDPGDNNENSDSDHQQNHNSGDHASGDGVGDAVDRHQWRAEETIPISVSVNKFGEIICRAAPGISSGNEKSSESLQNRSIQHFTLRRKLGRGTYGTVYLAHDEKLGRDVAIKVPNVSTSEEAIEIFLQEARQLAQVKHPNVVVVHEFGFDDEYGCFVVYQYVEGKDLNNWMQDNAPTWQEAIQIIAALGEGLSAAHAAGVIHRDVKPANIIISERSEGPIPVLVDFGLAISENVVGSAGARRGDITGTPNYMSPEQADGKGHRIDGRTDIYSLGVVLYRLLTGQLPFVAKDVFELIEVISEDEPRPPRQILHSLPIELETFCMKALQKDLEKRYTTAGDLAADLRALQKNAVAPTTGFSTIIETIPHSEKAIPDIKPNLRILVAEDNPASRLKLVATLEKWGHSVVEAEDGEQAWELFQKERFSIVITDWMMPKVDGLELVKRIRATRSSVYTYVIMLTAKSEKHDMILGMGAGADDFLSKPFQKDELNVRLRSGKRIVDMSLAIGRSGKRIVRGLQAAAKIQRAFLPQQIPAIPEFSFGWEYHPCQDLGGDMLNVVELDDHHIAVYLLDVNGSGVPASLLATTVSRFMAPASDPASLLFGGPVNGGSARKIRQPGEVAAKLNEQFSGNLEHSQYFTIIYGILNRNTRSFTFTSAGHPPFLYQKKDGETTFVEGFGLPIGVSSEGLDFDEETLEMASGDRIFLFSNGLPNTPNREDELFSFERVEEAISKNRGAEISSVLADLVQNVHEFGDHLELSDDVSVLGVEVK